MRARAENVADASCLQGRIVRAAGVAGMLVVAGLAGSAAWASSVNAVRAGVDPCTDQSPVASAIGDPFGHFDGVGSNLSQNVVSDQVPLFGWALDDDGIAAVDVLVDNSFIGRARLGESRPDVNAIFPGFPGGGQSGWYFALDTTNYLNGEHVVTARAISNAGEAAFLNARVFQFDNNTHNLDPFGEIDFPSDNSDAFGKCNPADPLRRFTVISGWALDAGVEIGDGGIGYVELLIDGSIVANSRLNCVHSPVTGTYSNCYGQRRLDVEQSYPRLRDSPNAGFRFVLDIGQLINFGYAEGHHILTIRAGDVTGQVANIDDIVVDFLCDPLQGQIDQGAIGAIDAVSEQPQATGVLVISGWALDPDRIERILIYVDGAFVGNAVYGFPRPEVTTNYPGFADSFAPGWIFNLDTTLFSHGFHSFQVLTQDSRGFQNLIGEGGFEGSNP